MNENDSVYIKTPNNRDSKSFTSIRSARMSREETINNFANQGLDKSWINALNQEINNLKQIEDRTQRQNKLLGEAETIQQKINETTEITKKNYESYLALLKEATEETIKLNKEVFNYNYSIAQTQEEQEKAARARNVSMQIYSDLLDDINEKLEENKNANKSQLDAFISNIDKIKSEIKDLAVVKGMGDITSGLFGSGNTSLLSTWNTARAQLGVSQSQFNTFKNDLTMQLRKSDNFFDFGWKDTAEYISKLGDLGITSQEMAQQQYLAVVQGTRYLGLTTETQAKILKISRDTKNNDLLLDTNKAIVQIMNAQLGISKEQLDAIVSQSADMADIMTMYSGNEDALIGLTKYASALEATYGVKAKDATMSIASDLLNNGYNSNYYSLLATGGNINDIIGKLQSGDASALYDIYNAVKNSNITSIGAEGIYGSQAVKGLGFDNNVVAINNSSATGSVAENMAKIEDSSNDINKTIKDFNKTLTDKIVNAGSNILSMLPFGEFVTLQNAYYSLAMIRILVMLPKTVRDIRDILLKDSIAGTKNVSLMTNILQRVGGIAMAVGGIAMAVNDAKEGQNKADEWGTGKTASAIGGFLGGTDNDTLTRMVKNVGKYALIGAGLGLLFGPAGSAAGLIIGGLVGIALGATTGAIGGENIAKGIDAILGGRTDVGAGGADYTPAATQTVGSLGATANPTPWKITSPFGPRTAIVNGKRVPGKTQVHHGVDFGRKKGTPFGAAMGGTVKSNGYSSSAGNYVSILGDDGLYYRYYHQVKKSPLAVGSYVQTGELVGYVGSTGNSTGPHLHFQVDRGSSSSAINPLPYATNGLFSPVTRAPEISIKQDESSERLLEDIISADTLANQAYSELSGAGGDIVSAVNGGFSGLNNKLDELANRQDNQEQVLRQLTNSTSNAAYQY